MKTIDLDKINGLGNDWFYLEFCKTEAEAKLVYKKIKDAHLKKDIDIPTGVSSQIINCCKERFFSVANEAFQDLLSSKLQVEIGYLVTTLKKSLDNEALNTAVTKAFLTYVQAPNDQAKFYHELSGEDSFHENTQKCFDFLNLVIDNELRRKLKALILNRLSIEEAIIPIPRKETVKAIRSYQFDANTNNRDKSLDKFNHFIANLAEAKYLYNKTGLNHSRAFSLIYAKQALNLSITINKVLNWNKQPKF